MGIPAIKEKREAAELQFAANCDFGSAGALYGIKDDRQENVACNCYIDSWKFGISR